MTQKTTGEDLRSKILNPGPYPRKNFILINVAGVLGAGFFVGVGETIHLAGVSTVLLFLIIGFIGLMVMRFQEEMISGNKKFKSFPEIAGLIWGTSGQIVVSGFYILAWACGLISEVLAASMMLNHLVPKVPVVVFCIIVSVFILLMNFINFWWFTAEFYLSFIGIFILIAFAIVAFCSILGLLPGTVNSVGTVNFESFNNIMPLGLKGFGGAIAGVVMIYGGIESMGTIADESLSPETDYISASRSSLYRVIFIYAIASIALAGLVPSAISSFIAPPVSYALELMGAHRIAVIIVNVFFVSCAISSAIYGMHVPYKVMAAFNKNNAPGESKLSAETNNSNKESFSKLRASSYSMIILPICVLFAYLYEVKGDIVYSFAFNLAGCGFLLVWMTIIIALPLYRRFMKRNGLEFVKLIKGIEVLAPMILIIMACGFVALIWRNVGRMALLTCLVWSLMMLVAARVSYNRKTKK